ncbi:type III secretion system apparatus protein YscQ/HrcQ [Collimonas sp. OK242]|jgi:type III secretion system YscQ/HrcQ family protein|uniref:type III secretion system cytoplasmic ring protein SctQ n=1 Tax=Collimonas sp. OK242 TaxID=1798195 RepID=UPI00089AA00B|nr:type III secretion system cytoplasmic ring protein SctQ [Collimonas sp. OK242]SDY73107.1 type III secretion system apparatus protein YscQ/HrcQ [Collimonas sp. OK242]
MLVEQCLPVLSDAWLEEMNQWLLWRSDIRFQLASGELELKWIEPQSETSQVRILFRQRDHRWAVGLNRLGALDARLNGAPFTEMPEVLRTLTVQKILSGLLEKFPSSVANDLDSAEVEWDPPHGPDGWQSFSFELTNMTQQTKSMGVFAVCSPLTLGWFRKHLPAARKEQSVAVGQLQVRTRLQVGITRLHAGQIAELSLGDLIWMDQVRLDKHGLQVGFDIETKGSNATFYAHWKHKILTVKSRPMDSTPGFQDLAANFSENAYMHIDMNQLELPVSFDLGELSLPVSEIAHIAPDYVFQLPDEAADAVVNVRIHGKLIAQGSLVLVGRRLAVRLTKVRQPDNLPDAGGVSLD